MQCNLTQWAFILTMIIPPCQAGSKGWRSSYESVVYGLKKDIWHNARVLGARMAVQIVAAGAYFFVNPIS